MTLLDFISGASTMGFLVASLFFTRFWRSSGEDLFAYFAAAFFLLGVTHALLTLGGMPIEERSWLYLLRLSAFLILLAGIARKNLSR